MNDQIENGVVMIHDGEGRGSVVGDYILTAAHCITWSGEMALGGWHIEEVESVNGAKANAQVVFVDPVSDVADFS